MGRGRRYARASVVLLLAERPRIGREEVAQADSRRIALHGLAGRFLLLLGLCESSATRERMYGAAPASQLALHSRARPRATHSSSSCAWLHLRRQTTDEEQTRQTGSARWILVGRRILVDVLGRRRSRVRRRRQLRQSLTGDSGRLGHADGHKRDKVASRGGCAATEQRGHSAGKETMQLACQHSARRPPNERSAITSSPSSTPP